MPAVRTDLATRALYSQAAGIQRILPRAVARPVDLHSLDAALRWAIERGLGVTPRGAGSAMDGSSIGAGLVLDCSVLDRRVEIDPLRRTARAGCALSLGALDTAASGHGLRFGPDPSSAAWATVGGVIGTNAAGARSLRLGAVDRWVSGLRLHTDAGPLDLVRGTPPDPGHPVIRRWLDHAMPILSAHRDAVLGRWPCTRKNTAGYGLDRYWESGELIDLVIGAEGTLGVVTEATLRLEPRPAVRASLRVRLQDRAALGAVVDILAGGQPTTIELLDRTFLRFAAPAMTEIGEQDLVHADALLLVDLEGDDHPAVSSMVRGLQAAVVGRGVTAEVATESGEIERLWSIRHRASPLLAARTDGRVSLQVIEDGCVPRAALAAYLGGVERVAEAHTVALVMFGHAGDGHVHVNLLPDLGRPDWLEAVRAIHDEVFELLRALGGTPSGEHGAGRLRAGVLEPLLGAEAIACFRAVKQAFDPAGRFNPGVILADGSDPFGQLKVGADALALPPGVAERLAAIEIGRGYAESRWPS